MKVRQKLWIAAGLCLAVTAFLLVTHYRAKAAAEKLKAQLRAQGEKLSIAELIPPPPTDGPNGSAAFLNAASQLSAIPDTLLPGAMKMTKPGHARVAFYLTVLPTYESTDVWPELGTRLNEHQSNFEELNTALSSPAFRFQIDYQRGLSTLPPHLSPLKNAIQRVSAQTLFKLHENQPPEALTALLSTVRIPARLQNEPVVISQLIRHGLVASAAAATWEALHYPGWNDAQLEWIQSTWESMAILSDVVSTLSMDRAVSLGEFENCRESLRRFDSMWGGGATSNPMDDLADIGTKAMGDPEVGLNAFLDRFPRRWVWKWWTGYQDETWFLNWSQLHLQSARQLESGVSYVAFAAQNATAISRLGEVPKAYLLSREAATSMYLGFLRRAATAETQRRIVIASVAIRRYRQRHGKLPATLSALAPEFLSAIPLDPMDGKLLRYQPASGSEFLLYSIGIDGKDDGGDPKPTSPTAKNFHWTNCRDWVWPMPASADEVREYHDSLEQQRRPRK